MIELSEEWLTEAAQRAADDEDAWRAGRLTWLALEDEPSATTEGHSSTTEADKRWAARFPALAKRHPRSDLRRWREAGARQNAHVFPIFATPKRSPAA
jgi:hypothetical protein